MARIPVGILGATGTVGQRFVQLLADHPWFEVSALAASERSAGQRYGAACHWLLPTPMPAGVGDLVIQPLESHLDCRLVFSALPSSVAESVEAHFAQAGYTVCSNAAAHRLDPDVPLLIPEVNADHTALIKVQQHRRRWKGFINTAANCSTTQLALALKPLQDAFGLRKLSVVTMQAVSGAGYPGVPSLDILDSLIPYIPGEEEKVERESRRLLGTLQPGTSEAASSVAEAPFVVSAQCNRVAIRNGHTECISVEFETKPDTADVVAALRDFRGPVEVTELPSSPARPVVVRPEPDRPQPSRDLDTGRGMAVVVGRVRPCSIFDSKFVLLGHNTVRGAAGGSIHNAELLVAQGWVA